MSTAAKVIFIIVIVAVMGCVTFLAFSFYNLQNNLNSKFDALEKKIETTQTQQKETATEPTVNKIPFKEGEITEETGTIDGGNIHGDIKVDVKYSGTDCTTSECFDEKFAKCEPTEFIAENGLLGAFYYKILGPQNGRCAILNKYTKNPNPEWVNKEMTCFYDNTKTLKDAFLEAVGSSEYCRGELFDILPKSSN